jgi:hypothetical protein
MNAPPQCLLTCLWNQLVEEEATAAADGITKQVEEAEQVRVI